MRLPSVRHRKPAVHSWVGAGASIATPAREGSWMPSVSYRQDGDTQLHGWESSQSRQEDDMLKKMAAIGGAITLAAAIPSAAQAQALQNQEVPAATTKAVGNQLVGAF